MNAGVLKPTHWQSKWLSETKLMMLQNDKLLRVVDLRDPQRIVQTEKVKARMLMVTVLTWKVCGGGGGVCSGKDLATSSPLQMRLTLTHTGPRV